MNQMDKKTGSMRTAGADMESLRVQREGLLLNLAKTKQLKVQHGTSVQLERCPSTNSATQPLSEKNILILLFQQNSEKSPGTLTSDPFYELKCKADVQFNAE